MIPWGRSEHLAFWTMLRGRSRVLFLCAVFFLFSSVGLIALQINTDRLSVGKVLLRVLLSGGFAVGYAGLAIARRFRYLMVLVVVQIAIETLVGRLSPSAESIAGQPEALHRQSMVLGISAMAGIIAAYSLAMHFFNVEGKRYYEARTEIALAAEIHSSLVPACEKTAGGFEIYGASVPSGEVGGDLVDIVTTPQGWIGYVADVSGHGVQSGVLMAMFKTALRAQISSGNSLAKMLEDVNRTLFPLKLQTMFVTAAILRGEGGGIVSFASAGHPPILHCHKKNSTVSEQGALDPPLGIAEGQKFSEGRIQCEPGDVLLVLTDGLTEVFDARGNEMGPEQVRAAFVENIELPPAELFGKLRAVASRFGRQTDDQTLLLARCTAVE
jgi:serine phosphatase RsbU (regulator of sigma subunit)